MQDAQADERIRDEFGRVVSVVEEMTGLASRWRGEARVIQPQNQLFAGQFFKARKDWDCGVSVAAGLAEDDLRWRTLIHEALHTVSVGLNEQDYQAHRGWEEAIVETLQRQVRPAVFARLGVFVADTLFEQVEAFWLYEHYVKALRRLSAGFTPDSEQEFLQVLLGVRLRERKTYVFAWGKRTAPDFEQFKRVYAEAGGVLSR